MAGQTDYSPPPGVEAQEISGVPFQPGGGGMGLEGIRGGEDNHDSEGVGRQAKLSLYRKLAAILSSIDRIGKDKENTGGGGYRYASEKAIKEAFHPLFMEHRILIVPVFAEMLHFSQPSQGKTSYITTVRYSFELLDLDGGGTLPMQIILSGGDALDKGATKALTGAIKYALTTLFLIPTGDDPEADPKGQDRKEPQARQTAQRGQKDQNATITEAQMKRMFSLASAAGMTATRAKEIVGSFGYESSKDILAKDYDAICAEFQP